jgi:DNA-binding transcriptional MerR regulator
VDQVYAVKQVAALTGASEATLRVWERRYKVVVPLRSPSGYRMYDDDQVAILRAMVALVQSGVPASLAADTVRSMAARPRTGPTADQPDLVSAAAAVDPQALDSVLSAAFAADTFETVVDGWLPSALRQLGDAWHSGQLNVAQEHFASAGVARHLSAHFEKEQLSGGVPVLIGLPQGGRHELMLLAFAVCLRRRGVNAVYLGPDVPVDDWESVAADIGARVAVMGVHLPEDVAAAQAVVDRLRALRPPVAVRVGGALRHEIMGAGVLEDGVSRAAASLARDLAAGAV